MSVFQSRALSIILLTAAAVLFDCCAPKVTDSILPLDPPERFSNTGQQELPQKWWTSFEDESLNDLVQIALDSNFNLLAAWQRFQAAQALADRESSFLLPDVEAFFTAGRSIPEPDFRGGENQQIGMSANYEVDLWGRIRSQVQAERYRTDATQADYRAAAISLSAEITRAWYQLMAARRQQDLAQQQVETNENILKLIVARFGSGQIRGVDILRQKQLVEATRGQLISVESQIQVLENQMAVLIGEPPQEAIIYSPDTLPALPPLPATGIPVELIRRRPDVQSAFFRLQAADRELASAISARYPRLSINLSASARSNELDDVFRNWAYSLGGNLVAPLFYGGRISAEINRTEAVKQQLLYEYGQTVLVALQEVEDALIQEQKQLERIEVLREQVKLAQQAYQQLRVEYLNGLSDYLAVLAAANQEQQLQRDLISAKLDLIDFRVGLYRALAGGIDAGRREQALNEGD